jgi:hypothetical protein
MTLDLVASLTLTDAAAVLVYAAYVGVSFWVLDHD